ncbi:3-oxoacyl-[acyl-carrier-protein] reductase FabG [Zhongshania aliphaticivorans]|uniref:3-oxoacyl-[acyl-carrier-protein] reductase FabG n=1 Tax=Zhongshania aliphaticivorans TaxID=1470434 RepID=A0A5S9PGU9_9GAMM|nr:SDR family oxidoreductase [Zhongshania aliphaticivorans]CAA0103325.1 3-oxoacyl-[acyl-carrier-protein] reductase FabG [Zhongshania aliphaticivorans]CAA0113602.1 3-oxoacyl-[acyl-carrier-protein] reductase FabG [Zhongshania aliphaticivorans]
MDLKLKNKIALVTGSNRGTGQVIAHTLAREGATVVFHSNEEGEATEVMAATSAQVVWGDIASEQGCEQVLDQVSASVGAVDILVNNYGTATAGKWASSGSDDWLDMYQKNVLSGVRLIQGLSPAMREKGWGRIVQLGTIGSHQPNSIMPHYYASKGALATMGVSLSKELSHSGITVNTVSPGYIRTAELEAGFRRRAKKKGWGDDWADIVEKIVETEYPNPSGRIAERQEVADLVAFICSDLAGFINGQNIRIDGGAVCYV